MIIGLFNISWQPYEVVILEFPKFRKIFGSHEDTDER